MSTIYERMCEPPKVGNAQLLMVDNEPAVRSEGPETIQYLDPPQGLSTISGGGIAAPADEPLYVHVSALGVLSKFSYPMGLPRQIVPHKERQKLAEDKREDREQFRLLCCLVCWPA